MAKTIHEWKEVYDMNFVPLGIIKTFAKRLVTQSVPMNMIKKLS